MTKYILLRTDQICKMCLALNSSEKYFKQAGSMVFIYKYIGIQIEYLFLIHFSPFPINWRSAPKN